jgi:threonylcarbamoyladenosine tRNA methylthiotransferase MtaB
LHALLKHTDVPRLRLSSLEPWDLPASFFDLWADPRLCPHLHLPLQSGAPGTLRRMGRRITPEAYARLVDGARRAIPDVAITTDVIVGFPGESHLEFAQSLRLIEEMRFADVHAFRFSPRPGTAAARFGDRPAPNEVCARTAMLREVTQASSEAFRRALLGRTLPVLWEREPHSTPDGPQWHGLTHNFQRVQCAARAALANRILPTRLAALEDGVFLGLPAPDPSEPAVCQD